MTKKQMQLAELWAFLSLTSGNFKPKPGGLIMELFSELYWSLTEKEREEVYNEVPNQMKKLSN